LAQKAIDGALAVRGILHVISGQKKPLMVNGTAVVQ
jgi:hypothetical protein